jgi:hypothetical protein
MNTGGVRFLVFDDGEMIYEKQVLRLR